MNAHIKFNIKRAAARVKRRLTSAPKHNRIHFGCGGRIVPGWLNMDLSGSDYDMDFLDLPYPFHDSSVGEIVSQHVIEHFTITQARGILTELRRIMKAGGRLWISCPDMEKICKAYCEGHLIELYNKRRERFPSYNLGAIPVQHLVNEFFQQDGEHKVLYDYALIEWLLKDVGFSRIEKTSEGVLRENFPEFPVRADEESSLYVLAIVD